MVRRGKTELRLAIRAWIVLETADDVDNAKIAEHLGVALNTVIKWRKRFFEEGLDGLAERKRSDTTGIVPFGRLVEQVMGAEPYASAERVFWIVDNGSSHRGRASIERLEGQWPTLRLIHLPVHASWLDQCEIYFSIESTAWMGAGHQVSNSSFLRLNSWSLNAPVW
jgi:transposase-like protein